MGDRVGVVLSGAGARGAFQAGALATIVPALVEAGHRPSVFLGTSAGAINAALWGSYADLGPNDAAQRVIDTWRSIDSRDIYRNPAASLLLSDAPRFWLSVWGIGNGVPSLLDTTPLQRNAEQLFDPARLQANIRSGAIDGVGVTATRIPPGDPPQAPQTSPEQARSVVFVDAPGMPTDKIIDSTRGVDVADGPITAQQVLASAALPLAFPPIWIDAPDPFTGWYLDGGIRLNTPLRPAVSLGMDRIVVIDAMPVSCGGPLPSTPVGEPIPPVSEASALLLDSVLGDQIAEDLKIQMNVNHIVEQAAAAGMTLNDLQGQPLRSVPLMVVSPKPGELGTLAAAVIDEKTDPPLGPLRELEDFTLDRLLRGLGDSPGRVELLSYVYFDTDYFDAQIDLGAAAAAAALDGDWFTCPGSP